MSDDVVAALASCLPDFVVRGISEDPTPISEPKSERHEGAVLVADISGFTSISERLSERGVAGAEALNSLLNDYFGKAIERISAHGGDIVKFAGDALLAVWHADSAHDLGEVTRFAARCALDLQSGLNDYQAADGFRLSMKVGIGNGEVVAIHLGGALNRWELLTSGIAFDQAFAALDRAGAGQSTVSHRAWSSIEQDFSGEQLSMGVVLLQSGPTEPGMDHPSEAPIRSGMENALRAYLPEALKTRLASGQESWIGELRVVSVLFVNLPDLSYATPLDRAQSVMRQLQTALYQFEGSINKLNLDDKGVSLLAALGLPPLAHDDDALRAVLAAMAIRHRLYELGLRTSIGIATGRAFCGLIGSQRRREYTLLGSIVNLSARLMQTAQGDIVCDEATRSLAQSRVAFEPLPELRVKGMDQHVHVCRPTAERAATTDTRCALIARQDELAILSERLERLVRDNQPSVVVIEGDAGLGKSRLVAEALKAAERLGVTSLVGAASDVERSSMYYCWRSVFHQLLDLDAVPDSLAAQREHVMTRMQSEQELSDAAPLLSAVLPVDLPDNELTQTMSGQVRGENTRDFLLQVLRSAARRCPAMLVIDDVQWQDSASWLLTSLSCRRLAPVLVVLVARITKNATSEVFEEIANLPNATRIRLAPLTQAETSQLVRSCLNVDDVDNAVSEIIFQNAGGNPLHSEELAYEMRDQGLIRISGSRCELSTGPVKSVERSIPASLSAVITGRIDRLSPQQQLTVKVASVFGVEFSYRALFDCFPIEEDKLWLREHLLALVHAGLLEQEVRDAEIEYSFRHTFFHHIAYDTLLFAQRKQLHETIAQWYEQTHRENLTPHFPVLAHHWRRAEVPSRAIPYLVKAGEVALRSGAYREAATLLIAAIRLHGQGGLQGEPGERARWERQLGEAFLGMGRLQQGIKHLKKSLLLLHRAPPVPKSSVLMSVCYQAASQLFRRTARVRRRRRPEADGHAFIEAARAYEQLGTTYYLAGEKWRLLHATLTSLTQSESAGTSPELSRSYMSNSYTAGLIGLHRVASSYRRDGFEVAEQLGDRPCLAWAWEVTGIYNIGLGRLADACDALDKASDIWDELRDWHHWGESKAAMAQAEYWRGNSQRGNDLWCQVYRRAEEREDKLQQAWGLNGRAEGILKFGIGGSTEEAVEMLEMAVRLFSQNVDRISLIGSYGLLSTALLRLDDMDAARNAAEHGKRLAEQLATSVTAYYSLVGFAGISLTFLALPDSQSDRRAAGQACGALDRYARVFQVGRPTARRCRGLAQWAAGKRRAALRNWHAGLAAAQRLGLPYEEGLAHLEIGRHSHAGSLDRGMHLEQALKVFSRLDAGFEFARAQQHLNAKP